MEVVINLVVLLAWVALARYIFRYLVRNELFKSYRACRCGYEIIHRDHPCAVRVPRSNAAYAGIAMVAAMFAPISLAYLAITYKPPVGPTEQAARIDALEKENNRLRQLSQ